MASVVWIFVLVELTNILINLDHGILPACTQEIAEFYHIGQTELGMLGSIVYLGIIVTGLYVGRLYQLIQSKLVCLIGLTGMCVSLLMFVLSHQVWLAMTSRFLTGAFQVFMLVYFPVWIDKFGGDRATLWITLLQVGVPLGIFAGYGMTSVIVTSTGVWQYSFYVQIGLILIGMVGFLFLPKDMLDVKETVAHSSQLDEHLMIREGQVKKKPTYMQLLCILLKTRMYLIAILTMSVMLFVSTGIQFWMTNYFIEVLHFKRESVNIAYAVVSITGPTLGAGFGGYVVNSIGGYSEPRSIYFIWVFSVAGIGAAVVIPFVSTFFISAILLWIVLFFGGAMVPGLTGMIMSSVQPEMRSFGNSKGEIIKNTLGYFPSPFLYGLINSLSSNPRAGITMILFWGLWAPLLLGLGSYWTFRQGKKALEVPHEVTVQSDSECDSPTRRNFQGINEERAEPQLQATASAGEPTTTSQQVRPEAISAEV